MLWPIRRVEGYPSIWQDSGRLHRSLDDLLEDFFGGFGVESGTETGIAPRVDLSETDDAVLIEAELPGMEEKDIELTLQDNVLTLKGEKTNTAESKKKNCYVSERSYGQFQRSLRLGPGLDYDRVDASFKNGVLTVTLPKVEPEKNTARTIDIKAA